MGLSAVPCFAQGPTTADQPRARAEDPAYTESAHSSESYTIDEVETTEQTANPQLGGTPTQPAPVSPSPIERGPASAYQPQNPSRSQTSVAPSAPDETLQRNQPPSTPDTSVTQQPQQIENRKPMFLENAQRGDANQPAPQPPVLRAPAATPNSQSQGQPGRMESQQEGSAPGTQLAFFEITPTLGSISIKDTNAFSVGTNLSFRLARNTAFYFEPSIYVSFLSGQQNSPNATVYHLDGGLRYDFVISESPLIPFLKAAVGPSITSNANTLTNDGDTLGDSYVNVFAGGGLKVLINPNIGARIDAGMTFQGTDPGLYAMGAVALPL